MDFPYRLYSGHAQWIPPLRSEMKKLLDASHPVYKNVSMSLFLCEKDCVIAGRAAFIRNRLFSERWGGDKAFFGFFDTINDAEVAGRLLGAVESEAKKAGHTGIIGPVSPTINYPSGILLNMYDTPNTILMPYNYDYYQRLLEELGYVKSKELLSYEVTVTELKMELFKRLPETRGVTYRTMNIRRIEDEVVKVTEIFNNAWESNWGFVPITRDEAALMARGLRQVIKPELVIFAVKDGVEIGFIMAIPDINQMLAGLDGRLLPFGWLKLLTRARRVKRFRVITLGVLKKHQGTTIAYHLIGKLIENGMKHKYVKAELSWILDDNVKMIKPIERIGARLTQRFGMYEKTLS